MVRIFGRCLPIICFSRKKRQSLPIGEQKTSGTRHHQEEVNKLFVRRVESIRVTQQGGIAKRLPLTNVDEQRATSKKKTKSKAKASAAAAAAETPKKKMKKMKNSKPDDTEFDCETHISEHPTKHKAKLTKNKGQKQPELVRTRTPLEKLFKKSKTKKIPSPEPSSILDKSQDDYHQSSCSLTSSISSEWSTSTYSDSQSSEKSDEIIDVVRQRKSSPMKNELKHRSCGERFYIGKEHVGSSASPVAAAVKYRNSQITSSTKTTDSKIPGKSKQVLENVRKMMKDQNIQDEHFQNLRQRESVRL